MPSSRRSRSIACAESARHYLEAIRLAGRDERLRQAADAALAALAAASPEAAQALKAAAQDPDPAVRDAARAALGGRTTR